VDRNRDRKIALAGPRKVAHSVSMGGGGPHSIARTGEDCQDVISAALQDDAVVRLDHVGHGRLVVGGQRGAGLVVDEVVDDVSPADKIGENEGRDAAERELTA